MPLYAYRYYLFWGGKIVYAGITDDPQRRLSEHRNKFPGVAMEVQGEAVVRQDALLWEQQQKAKGITTEL